MLYNHHINFYFPSKKYGKNWKIKIYLLINVHTRETITTKKLTVNLINSTYWEQQQAKKGFKPKSDFVISKFVFFIASIKKH